jgi:hypothetical protein
MRNSRLYNYERLELMNIQKSLRNLDGKRFWILLDLFEKVPFQIQEYLGRGGNAAPLWSEPLHPSKGGEWRQLERRGQAQPHLNDHPRLSKQGNSFSLHGSNNV